MPVVPFTGRRVDRYRRRDAKIAAVPRCLLVLGGVQHRRNRRRREIGRMTWTPPRIAARGRERRDRTPPRRFARRHEFTGSTTREPGAKVRPANSRSRSAIAGKLMITKVIISNFCTTKWGGGNGGEREEVKRMEAVPDDTRSMGWVIGGIGEC